MVSSDRRLQVYRYYFVKHLLRPGDRESINFTLKFRTSSSDTWKWVKENFSVKDGELCFQPAKLPSKLGNYLEGLHGTSHSVTSEVPEALLWLVTTTVHSGYNEDALGIPKSFTRWFSLARISSPWIAPRHGQGKFAPAEDCILSSFLRSDGLHLVVLPVSGVNDVLVTLRSDSQGYIIIHSKKDSRNYSSTSLVNILIAAGRSFEAALAAVMYQARSIVANSPSIGEKNDSETQMLLNKEIKPEWMESWYDGLTYCTWNALGQNLNQQKIFDALDDLKSNNVNITNLIIDDNWQSLDNAGSSQFNRGMTEFEANKEGFPKGLKHAITRIRDNHPSIEHVAVWHALFGYWGGISPAGIIADMYKTKVVRKQGGIASDLMTVVDADDAPRFYEDFYKFLLSSGVDTVKTDAQCFLDLIVDLNDRQRFITTYQDAWTIASLRYFSTKAISCMSQVPQIIFHTQFPTDKPRLMVRNSNDFFPDVPSSHPWHIFSNAHNAAFTSFLNVIPDWDMFQTSHPYSSFHAAGRCVSAGPIHITDEPGKHDLNLLKQMTAQTTNGKTIILRPDSVGKTMNVYTAYEEERFLKVCTFVGGKGGTSILGCFNISERWLSELIQLNEFRGIESDEEYIIRTFTSGELSPMISRGSEFPLVLLDLDIKGWEILTAYPLQAFTLRGSRGVKDLTKLAILGLLGKMTGAAAVVESSMQVEETGRLKVKAALKALGSLGGLLNKYLILFSDAANTR